MEAVSDQQLCTYARINTLDLMLSPELNEYWHEPSSYFLAPGMPSSFYPCTMKASHSVSTADSPGILPTGNHALGNSCSLHLATWSVKLTSAG